MTVVVDWLVENRVIIWMSSGKVTGGQMAAGNESVRALIAQARANSVQEVQIFVDIFRAEYSPMSLYAMRDWLTYLKEDGFDWHVICVKHPKLYRMCTNFAFRFMNRRIIVEDDLVEGLQFLEGKDETLPDLLDRYQRWIQLQREAV